MNTYIEEILDYKISTYQANSTQATNSQRKHIKEIFSFILNENIKSVNQYGYSEISYLKFKAISRTHYKEILFWLEYQNLIQIRKSNKGVISHSGLQKLYIQDKDKFIITDKILTKPFCVGYKVNPDLIEFSGLFFKEYSEYSIHVKNILSNPSHTIIRKGHSSSNNQSNLELNSKLNSGNNTNPSHTIIRKGHSSLEEWNYETCWNALTIIKDEGLFESEYLKYQDGLQKKYAFKSGRYYGTFHNMKNEHIQYLRLFGEKISEWGDGTAFFFKLIGKLIEDVDYIPYNEKYKFQSVVINDPYVYFMKKLYLKDRQTAKTLLNVYMNSTNNRAIKMTDIDKYFQKEFPNIRKWLREIPVKKVNNEFKKQLWKLNQNMENEIMNKLCVKLNKEYGVFPLTKHDAIYLNDSDIKTLNENNVNFDVEIKKILDYKYFNDIMFDL